ncbi:hypothetical protein FACS1894164_12200 [Spirochaetia bacterium]|nr:hypothetical protein FACS1894164_12200 [Spirochaetia bacterium]
MSQEDAQKEKWSWTYHWIKYSSRPFVFTAVWVIMAFVSIMKDSDSKAVEYIVLIAGGLSVIYVLGDKLLQWGDKLIEKAKINVNVGKE